MFSNIQWECLESCGWAGTESNLRASESEQSEICLLNKLIKNELWGRFCEPSALIKNQVRAKSSTDLVLKRISTLGINKSTHIWGSTQEWRHERPTGKLRKAETLLEQITRKISQSNHSHEAPRFQETIRWKTKRPNKTLPEDLVLKTKKTQQEWPCPGTDKRQLVNPARLEGLSG